MSAIKINCSLTPLVKKTAAFLRGHDVVLEITPGIGAEGFRIEDTGTGPTRIIGNDECGLLYGAGKFRRDPAWRGTAVPEKPIRAIYFATHFHNFYHAAPIAKVNRYIDELALWGCNTLMVWFDMHHYLGITDPAAQAMIRRLHVILQTGQAVGMRICLGGPVNEAFATSPPTLRADWTAGHDGYFAEPQGHYHVEICPNKPGGLELILKYRQQMLAAFRDLDIGYFTLWPYDQGGCTCARCAPWGTNGFLKTAAAVTQLVRKTWPKTKTILSTWYFDHFTTGEWAGLTQQFAAQKPDWVDYLLTDDCGRFPEYPLQHGVPGGFPAVSFPEISMDAMGPWGGFGANPRPAFWQRYWDTAGSKLAGSVPYSEGIFEDLNKVLHLQLNWDSRRTTREIAREYAASEFAPAVADAVVAMLLELEGALNHNVDFGTVGTVLAAGGWDKIKGPPPSIYWQPQVTAPEPSADSCRQINAQLPVATRKSWRWRIIFLRALLDEELKHSGGRPTNLSDEYFEELTRIYHGEQAELYVSPVSRRQLTRLQQQLPIPVSPAAAPQPSR